MNVNCAKAIIGTIFLFNVASLVVKAQMATDFIGGLLPTQWIMTPDMVVKPSELLKAPQTEQKPDGIITAPESIAGLGGSELTSQGNSNPVTAKDIEYRQSLSTSSDLMKQYLINGYNNSPDYNGLMAKLAANGNNTIFIDDDGTQYNLTDPVQSEMFFQKHTPKNTEDKCKYKANVTWWDDFKMKSESYCTIQADHKVYTAKDCLKSPIGHYHDCKNMNVWSVPNITVGEAKHYDRLMARMKAKYEKYESYLVNRGFWSDNRYIAGEIREEIVNAFYNAGLEQIYDDMSAIYDEWNEV